MPAHRDHAGVDQRVEATIFLCTDRHALLSGGASPHDAVDALARERYPDRSSSDSRRCCRKDLVLPQTLGAECAAYVWRRDLNVVLLQSEYLSQRPGCVHDTLRGIVDDQLVAIPRQGRGMRLDGVVVVARRHIDFVDLVRRARQCRFSVVYFGLQRLSEKNAGLKWQCLRLVKIRSRQLRLIGGANQ